MAEHAGSDRPPMSAVTLTKLRSTRDFRAEVLQVAAGLSTSEESIVVRVERPAISPQTVQQEWERLLPAIRPAIARRMRLEVIEASSPARSIAASSGRGLSAIPIDRVNYLAEVLRLLVQATLRNDGRWSQKGLMQAIGASQTPVRKALSELRRVSLLRDAGGAQEELKINELSAERLAKLGATPQRLRFRFERGANLRTPIELLDRALDLLKSGKPGPWHSIGLSGTPVAQAEAAAIDIAGVPRLDLVALVPRYSQVFDPAPLRKLSQGLEFEPNSLAATPVVVTLIRAVKNDLRAGPVNAARCARPADVFLSLLDQNLRAQATQYASVLQS